MLRRVTQKGKILKKENQISSQTLGFTFPVGQSQPSPLLYWLTLTAGTFLDGRHCQCTLTSKTTALFITPCENNFRKKRYE